MSKYTKGKTRMDILYKKLSEKELSRIIKMRIDKLFMKEELTLIIIGYIIIRGL